MPRAKPKPKPKRTKSDAATRFHVKRLEARKVLGGVAQRTFATLESEGIIIPTRRGRRGRPSIYDLATIVPAYIAYVTQKPNGHKARDLRDLAIAELTQLKIAKEQGHLIPRQQAVTEGQAFGKAWSAMVRALPRRMAQAGLLADGQEAVVAGMCRDILTEIARWQTLADIEPLLEDEGA
jgi:phage terminase Nu1 subunit (DNA packaging protein)